MKNSYYESIVFAGGGGRCVWQVGFLKTVLPVLKKPPRVVAAVSAGAAMSCIYFSGGFSRAYDYFIDAASKNKRNFYPVNLFSSRPVFPHAEIYRAALNHSITAKGFKKLKEGPEIRIMITRPPSKIGPRLATFLGIGAYSLEKIIKNPVHPSYSRKLGFTPLMVRAGDCETREELAELIISSSCTPPFTPLMRWGSEPSLDGGLVDNVPAEAVDDLSGRSLILLTRQYPDSSIPAHPSREYIQPLTPIKISKWDYTNPEGIAEAYEQGIREGREYIKLFSRRNQPPDKQKIISGNTRLS